MSTRCNIHFTYGDRVQANIYRHYDGYPEEVLPDLEKFFSEVEAQTSDTRFNDPSYLAAKFVVWQASQYSLSEKPLAFLGIGVTQQDAEDGEYTYKVDCTRHDEKGHPIVEVER